MMLWISLIAIVIVAAVVATSHVFARSSLKAPIRPREANHPTTLPLQPIEANGKAGKLRGWFISHDQAKKRPTILLTHGWGRNAAQMIPYAEFLFPKGYNLCLFDVRGHGNSDPDQDGLSTMLRYAEDIMSMADYCCERPDVDPARLGHLGHSMGAASSFYAASIGKQFRCIIASSGFADLRDLMRWMLRAAHLPAFPFQNLIQHFWQRMSRIAIDDINPVSILPRLTLPVFIAHGDRDVVVDPGQFHKLLSRAANGNVQSLLMPGKNHSDLHTDAQYVRVVQEFFAQHL
jgi:pimeloyl-ACP methyl ester carboxylesterase